MVKYITKQHSHSISVEPAHTSHSAEKCQSTVDSVEQSKIKFTDMISSDSKIIQKSNKNIPIPSKPKDT